MTKKKAAKKAAKKTSPKRVLPGTAVVKRAGGYDSNKPRKSAKRVPTPSRPGPPSRKRAFSEADVKLRERLNKYKTDENQTWGSIALDISMRRVVKVTYLQLYRWGHGLAAPVTDRRKELDAFLSERGY